MLDSSLYGIWDRSTATVTSESLNRNHLEAPAKAAADAQFIFLGVQRRPAVEIVPKGEVVMEVVGEFYAERILCR